MSTLSIIITVAVFLSAAWVIPILSGGYANTVDRIGLFLHRHAVKTRQRQQERAAALLGMWDEALKLNAVPAVKRRREAEPKQTRTRAVSIRKEAAL